MKLNDSELRFVVRLVRVQYIKIKRKKAHVCELFFLVVPYFFVFYISTLFIIITEWLSFFPLKTLPWHGRRTNMKGNVREQDKLHSNEETPAKTKFCLSGVRH